MSTSPDTAVFESSDLGESEDFLREAYAKLRLGSDQSSTHARIAPSMAEVTLDEFDIGFDLTYDVDPLGRIAVCVVRAGSFPAARVRGLV